VVHPRLAGHGPTLFAGLSKRIDLRLVNRLEFGSGAVAMPRTTGRLRHGRSREPEYGEAPMSLFAFPSRATEHLVAMPPAEAPTLDRILGPQPAGSQ
jgi:hypothetical protein